MGSEPDLTLRAKIFSNNNSFTEIGYSQDFSIVHQYENELEVAYNGNSFTQDLFIMFRTEVMEETILLYQKSEDYPGKVALMAQFLPTFNKESKRKKLLV